MADKLEIRDLITIGIFSAVYLVVYIVLSAVLFTPFLFLLILPIGALLMGPVYMLLIARAGKPLAITFLATLTAVVAGLLVYGNLLIAAVNFGFGMLAELIAYLGKYKKFGWLTASYSAMSLWVVGQVGAFWVAPAYMRELTITSGYDAPYADGVLALATPFNLALILIGTVIAAIVSASIAQRMLTKHFKRAGIA